MSASWRRSKQSELAGYGLCRGAAREKERVGQREKILRGLTNNIGTNQSCLTRLNCGNDNSSSKPQHRYEISEKETGDVKKTGISGQELNENGTSPRANQQVNAANRAAGDGKYEGRVVDTNIPGRAAAKEVEKAATNKLNEEGHSLDWQKLPRPDK